MQIKRYLSGILALFAVSAVTAGASARSISNVTITEVAEHKGSGKIWVRFSAALPGTKPTCVDTGWETYLAFDPTTPAGTRLLTIVWSAMLAGKRVDASGLNTCTNVNGLSSGDVEEFNFIKVYAN
jgi:hypothetical protein